MTVNHTLVPSTQSDFTVLVSVTDPALKTLANGGHVANTNGYDIGFYADSGGTIKLKWEVENYNGATGNLIAWVKIPTLSSTTDTPFYLFYGDLSITTDQSDPVNTWDSNFKAVYHLGNGTTLSATDSTGGNNGTLINSPTATAGKIDGAAHFVSTSGQLISLANPGDFPITTAWTMEAWVKPSTDGNIVLMWGGTSNNGPHMVLPGNNSWRVGFWGGADVNGTGVDTSAFHHIVGTFDGSSLRLYKDGSLLAGPTAASPTTSSSLSAVIGASSFWSSTFNGNIDEVRISGTNRSANWVTAEYNNQNSPGTFITMGSESCQSSTPTPTPTATPTPSATPATGLVAAYGFNEGNGTVVNDASGNGNNGTINGATWTTSGKYGNALNFNGSNALVTINNAASLQLTTGMTLEAWVYPTVTGPWWGDVIYKGNDNYYLEGTSYSSGFPAMGGTLPNAPPLYGTAVLALNTWAHLAATYDGVTMRLYVNGVPVVSRAQTGAIETSTNPLQIGGDSIYGQYFMGRIDEVRIYNRALSAAQIQSDMNTPL